MNVPIGKQELQPQLPIAEAEMDSEKSGSAIASSEAAIEKSGATRIQKPSVRIVEYGNEPKKTVVPTTSVL